MNNKEMLKHFIIFSFILVLCVAWASNKWIFDEGPAEQNTVVLINKGAGSSLVANKLQKAGVINKPWLFKIVARISGLDKKLKAGEYEFPAKISMNDVLQKMKNGEIVYRQITLAEGLTTKQMLQTIEENEFLSGEISVEAKDGELLPETYTFIRGDSKDNVVKQAKKAMTEAIDNAWDNRDEFIPLKNKNELLILASIIEKETGVREERGLVASVFVNRLKKRMRLQTDPTVIYALTLGQKDLGRLLTKKDLQIDSPYNTYKYYGLPPSAICNPGKESLEAAANPELSDYLYFVANGNGGHNFAKSLKEHNSNVANWKKIRK